MTTLFMVRSNPKPGQETAFNDWYTDVHLPEVLSIQGFLSAQRFTLNEAQVQPDQTQSYLAIYEIDTDHVPGTLEQLRKAPWLNMSDAIDPANINISIFSAITDKLTSDT
ncbi:MAG: hypothetical protein GWP45_10515 [Proteobacteria bacterium]|nr:hypothetical protein [Pseudomonadota bacterium]